jgi:hypothetical protein
MNMNTTPNQDTLQAIKEATVETLTIECSAELIGLHPLTQALAIGDNASNILKQLIEDAQTDSSAREQIITVWYEMASLGKLASIRTLLNRQSKAVLKYALTVKDGQLIAAQTRAKPSKVATETTETTETSAEHLAQDDDLTRLKRWFTSADAEKRAKVLALIAKLG